MGWKARLRGRHTEAAERFLKFARPVAWPVEWLVFGGVRRRRLLVRMLRLQFASQRRRDWLWSRDKPHFYDQRHTLLELGFGRRHSGPYPLFRGFYASEVVRPHDRVLDIGCGDGFFASRFLGPRCAHVDALDIEPEAVRTARRDHARPNVSYHLLDATGDPFPGRDYDVIVWDGALGHFPPETNARMLVKIRDHLAEGGVFLGSESLGRDDRDHLQFFGALDDLEAVLLPVFAHVALREFEYDVPGLTRREGFWRCSQDRGRIDSSWTVRSRSPGPAAT